tara:strand:- start:213 stop:824 length:612 start_codon:yes stop_codon:yes gene_type:complete
MGTGARIARAMGYEFLSDWSRGFLESISQQYNRSGKLSPKQLSMLEKIEKSNDPDVLENKRRWVKNFDEKKKENLKVVARYYDCAGYFQRLVSKVLRPEDGKEYIPTEKEYRSMCENKYAMKILAAWNEKPLYDNGSMVLLRTSAPLSIKRVCNNDQAIVLQSNAKEPISAAKGAKIYKILPVGSAETFFIEERYIKKYKKKR